LYPLGLVLLQAPPEPEKFGEKIKKNWAQVRGVRKAMVRFNSARSLADTMKASMGAAEGRTGPGLSKVSPSDADMLEEGRGGEQPSAPRITRDMFATEADTTTDLISSIKRLGRGSKKPKPPPMSPSVSLAAEARRSSQIAHDFLGEYQGEYGVTDMDAASLDSAFQEVRRMSATHLVDDDDDDELNMDEERKDGDRGRGGGSRGEEGGNRVMNFLGHSSTSTATSAKVRNVSFAHTAEGGGAANGGNSDDDASRGSPDFEGLVSDVMGDPPVQDSGVMLPGIPSSGIS
jgi:hypothetical protein